MGKRFFLLLCLPVLRVLTIFIEKTTLTASSARNGVAFFDDHPGDAHVREQMKKYSSPPLHELTRQSDYPDCEEDLNFVDDKAEPENKTIRRTGPRIPRIVHQTSKSRCLTARLYNATRTWDIPGWSYYFHDDDAVDSLLQMDFPEFPHLRQVAESCLLSGTVKADLWRYVVLWVYGGVYADIDSAPHKFSADTIDPFDDGFFVVEQYHLLSQYFMAVSPRHPLMYYAIQRALLNLLQVPDTGRLNAAFVTGPHALHAGYRDFMLDAGVRVDPAGTGYKPAWSGKFVGTENRSITVVGIGENENEYVWRSIVKKGQKVGEYKAMGMAHFQDFTKSEYSTGISCLSAIRRPVSTTIVDFK
jgi:hypothetical protein